MASHTSVIQDLIDELARMPGIGARSAERIAFHLLKSPAEDALRLADAIRDVKTRVKHCSICFNLTEDDPCPICRDTRRDQSTVCVVEQPKDLISFEETGIFGGGYHVLLGRISPLEDIGPEDLTIDALLDRIPGTDDQYGDRPPISEIILATNPTLEGDGTALHLTEVLHGRHPNVKVTRLARGLSAGGSIEFANRNMLADALAGRSSVD
ncbi:MAG: recombination mediator RecR [Planctomycetota bacterium]